MSKRNSPEAKRAARERLRAERERQAKREKVRRQFVVGGSVLAILAVAGGIGVAVASMESGDGGGGDSTDWDAVAAQIAGEAEEGAEEYPTEAPANTGGENGLTIRVGDDNAENTLTLFEDARCPACAQFEQVMGANVREGVENDSYAAEYVFATFIDGMASGVGSKNALSALGAALNVSEEAFLDYHDALYTAENHPPESDDAFGDDERLIEIAQDIPELADNQQFENDVLNSTYAVWALQMSDKFSSTEGVSSTPTLMWNGELIPAEEMPQSAEQFDQFIADRTE